MCLQNKKVSKNINSNLIFYSLFVECVIVSCKLFFSYGVVFPGKGLGLYLFFKENFIKKYTIPCCQVRRVRYEIYVDQLLYSHINTMYLSFSMFLFIPNEEKNMIDNQSLKKAQMYLNVALLCFLQISSG